MFFQIWGLLLGKSGVIPQSHLVFLFTLAPCSDNIGLVGEKCYKLSKVKLSQIKFKKSKSTKMWNLDVM